MIPTAFTRLKKKKKQGFKFSAFRLVSDVFTLTPLKDIFEISSLEYFSHYLMVNSDFSDFFFLFQTFSIESELHP